MKDKPDPGFHVLYTNGLAEIHFQAGNRSGRFTVFPETVGTKFGELSDDGILQFFGDINGELLTTAAQLAEDFLHAIEESFFSRTVIVLECSGEFRNQLFLFLTQLYRNRDIDRDIKVPA